MYTQNDRNPMIKNTMNEKRKKGMIFAFTLVILAILLIIVGVKQQLKEEGKTMDVGGSVENENQDIQSENENKNFIMVIHDVISITGKGNLLTGHVQQGKIKLDEEVLLVGLKEKIKTTVVQIESRHSVDEEANEGDDIAILLKDSQSMDKDSIFFLTSGNDVALTAKIGVNIKLLSKEEGGIDESLVHDANLVLSIGDQKLKGKVQLENPEDQILPGQQNIKMDFSLFDEVNLTLGMEFTIYNENNRKIGKGKIMKIY